MKIVESLKPREHVDDKLKWDLTDLFTNQEAFEQAKQQLDEKTSFFVSKYKGQLTDVDTIIEALDTYDDNKQISDRLSVYVTLKQDTDLSNTDNLENSRRTASFLAKMASKVSFFKSEILDNDVDILIAIADKEPAYEAYVRKLLQEHEGKLSEDTEQTLAVYQTVFKQPLEMFEQVRSNDLEFGTFVVNGTEYPLSFVLYEEFYMYHPDKDIRRAAYKQFSETLACHQNVMASIYYTQVAQEKTTAELRGFDSVIDYLLVEQEVDRDKYDRQIDVIMDKFAPVIRRYLTNLKTNVGLDELFYADMKIDYDPDIDKIISIEQGKEMIFEALKPLGDDYLNIITEAFDKRWIDFSRNKGKRTGATSTTAYGQHPYIIMSWSDRVDSAYTLIHELGHAGQSLYSNANQRLSSARPSLYLIEAPSTFNELLMTKSLYDKYGDEPERKRMVLSTMMSKTYFHNFVTHLIEASFQRKVYRLIDAGESFSAETLNDLMYETNKEFFGDAVTLEAGVELTWMRQRHYYRGLYPYTYSAGLTISTNAFLDYVESDTDVIDRWIDFIGLGGSKAPVAAAEVAGVDISTEEPLLRTIDFLNKVVTEIEKLS